MVEAHKEKIQAALSSVFWSAFLTGLKIWAGVSTGSLGILSEALHSGLDFVAAAMTFYAVKMAARPADDGHPYGHEKVENLSALGETLLLVLTCGWILWEAVDRLFFNPSEVNLSLWAFGVVLVSLVVDVNRAAMLKRVAKKHRSQALEADALHFTTDIWSSGVVLLGLICVYLARFVPEGSGWQKALLHADSVAAMGVAFIVLGVAYGMGKRAIHALMDGGSKELTDSVKKALATKAPAFPLLRVRVRDIGSTAYVELDVGVSNELHVDVAHEVTELMERLVCEVIPHAEVIVHVEPLELGADEPLEHKVHHLAMRRHVRVHAYTQVECQEGLVVLMDVEVPSEWTLSEAQEVTALMEGEMKEHWGVKEVIMRLEPEHRSLKSGSSVALQEASVVMAEMREFLASKLEEKALCWQLVRLFEQKEKQDSGRVRLFVVTLSSEGPLSIGQAYRESQYWERVLEEKFGEQGKSVIIWR